MSFIKIISRLANFKYFLLVLSLILIIPFTPLEIMLLCSGGGSDFRINPARFNAPLKFLTGLTLLPIISDAWSATYYVDATNGNDDNTGLSEVTPWRTIAKVNVSRFNPTSGGKK